MTKLRKYCVLQVIACAVLAALVPALYHSHGFRLSQQLEVGGLKREIIKMHDELRSARRKETKLNNNFSVWRELSNTHVYYDDGESKSESVDSMLKSLCGKYSVFPQHLSVSDFEDVSTQFNKHHIKVAKSKISMSFRALTDKHVLLFVHAVRFDIPGFVAVRFLEIIRDHEISELAVDENIEARKEGVALAVSGRVEFELYQISGQHI